MYKVERKILYFEKNKCIIIFLAMSRLVFGNDNKKADDTTTNNISTLYTRWGREIIAFSHNNTAWISVGNWLEWCMLISDLRLYAYYGNFLYPNLFGLIKNADYAVGIFAVRSMGALVGQLTA